MSTGLVDIYEVKRSQRHFLTATLMKTADWSKESESLDISILSIFPQKNLFFINAICLREFFKPRQQQQQQQGLFKDLRTMLVDKK